MSSNSPPGVTGCEDEIVGEHTLVVSGPQLNMFVRYEDDSIDIEMDNDRLAGCADCECAAAGRCLMPLACWVEAGTGEEPTR